MADPSAFFSDLPTLETRRLRLRKMRLADDADFFAYELSKGQFQDLKLYAILRGDWDVVAGGTPGDASAPTAR